MALMAARFAARFAASRGARRAAAYAARQAMRRSARFASSAGRYAKTWARRNPMTTGFMAGGAAEHVYPRVSKRKLSSIRKGRIAKKQRTGPVPKTPSSRVPARYAVAPSMTKLRKAKASKVKIPKSAIVHYKEFGQFSAEKCMYINHEHWGHIDRFWQGIAYGLTRTLLAKAKIYNAKSMEDPCIGPRTKMDQIDRQYDDKSDGTVLRLGFYQETADGTGTKLTEDVQLEDLTPSPDVYRSFDAIATDVAAHLKNYYNWTYKRWLHDAQIFVGAVDGNNALNATPVYIQNLDEAEIHLYVNSLIKLQNVTTSDGGDLDKHSIDANPLVGRLFIGKAHKPEIDTDLLQSGDKTLDTFFGDVDDTTLGFTLLGHANGPSNDDVGRISHIPNARELYGNVHVKTANIHMRPGAEKFHKTSFKMVKTFRQLSNVWWFGTSLPAGTGRRLASHTMFGFTLQHRHGEDTIQIGWNRDVDVGCYIKHRPRVYPLKTNYTLDCGPISTTIVPTEHQ